MKTVFITITGGYGIRNILRSDAFKILKSEKDLRIIIFAPFVNGKNIVANLPEVQGKNIFFEDLARYKPNIVERVLRKIQEMVVFNINYVGTIKLKEMMLKKKKYSKYLLVKFVKKIFGKNRNFIKALENLDELLSVYKFRRLEQPFEKYKPSLVFSTDFLHLYAWVFVKTAKRCQVPVISMIANWDHLTKGILPKSDRVIAWNEFNRKQLIEYYSYSPKDILVAGIPHQDYFVHAKNRFLPKADFLESIGTPTDKKLITYTTQSVITTPFEPDIVEIICKAIKDGKIGHPAHLHVRLHPYDYFYRYEKLKKYGDIVTFEGPGKVVEERFWSGKLVMAAPTRFGIWCPDEEDMLHYANLISCTDVAVNIASSVTLDAAALDIPVINIGFDGYAQKEFIESNARYFMFTHFEFIPKSGGSRVARSANELIEQINMYLDNPALDSEGRKRIVAEHCGPQDGKCGERIAKYILDFIEKC